jgi:hypothetical protein
MSGTLSVSSSNRLYMADTFNGIRHMNVRVHYATECTWDNFSLFLWHACRSPITCQHVIHFSDWLNGVQHYLKGLQCVALHSFLAFSETRKFITAFTRALELSLPCTGPIQFTPSHPIYKISILVLFTNLLIDLPSGLFPSSFPTNNLYEFLFSIAPHVSPIPSFSTWLF